MARRGQVAFHQHPVVAERRRGLALRPLQRRAERRRVRHDAHAFSAAAGAGLDQHGEADARRLRRQQRRVLRRAVIAGDQRDARLRHQRLRRGLGPHGANGGGGRPDEHDASRLARGGEAGVLRQEAIAGVHRLRAGPAGRVQDGVAAQVAVARRRRAHWPCLVGHLHVARVAVGVGVDGNGGDAHPPRGEHHAAGDLAPVGDEDFPEHAHIRNRPKRVGGIGAFRLADRPSASTRRVSAGSITPSSHSRADE